MPPRSRFVGQNVDASSRRSIGIVTERDPASPAVRKASQLVVDFFYHAGEFFRAVIPLHAVDRVFGQAFNFSKARTRQGDHGPEVRLNRQGLPRRSMPLLNHVQSRFLLKPDQTIELYRLGSHPGGEVVHRVSDFVYSLEAVGPVGSRFNVRDGLAGNFISAHRFLSTQEMVFERMVLEQQYITESPPLPLDDRDKRELLIESLLQSHQAGMSEPYYLYGIRGTNNCTSSPFQILDKVVEYNWLQWIGARLYRLPLNPRFYLWVRGLDSDPSYHKLLGPEFEDYLQDPTTQQRKDNTLRQRDCPCPPESLG